MDISNNKIEHKNIVIVDLIGNETYSGNLELSAQNIEISAGILSDMLLYYAKNGGNMSEITPEGVDSLMCRKRKEI